MAGGTMLRTKAQRARCEASASLFEAVERALDSELGRCYVTDANGRLVGEVTLDRARALIRGGDYLAGLSAGAAALPVAKTLNEGDKLIGFGAECAPVLDRDGAMVAVAVDRTATFLPVAEPYLSHSEFRNLLDAFLSTWISSQGQYIREFESQFAKRMRASYAVATSNGTVSLHLALVGLGIGPGDEVIVPDLTFAASINAVIHAGATPVLVDVDPDTWVLAPDTFERAITSRTRGVMPVHVFGRPCPMTEIMDIATRRGIFVIEDAAESHGATYDGRPVGSFGHAGSFSFFGNKNITTGEGGIVLTDEPELAERLRVLRDHGMKPERRYWHDEVGYNYRMTNLQASIGLAQLERLDEMLGHRENCAGLYREKMDGIPSLEFPKPMGERCGPVTWLACAEVPAEKRAELIAACKERAIDLRPFFHGLSTMPAYRRYSRPCPTSHRLSRRGVNLPTSPRVDETVASLMADIFWRVLGRA